MIRTHWFWLILMLFFVVYPIVIVSLFAFCIYFSYTWVVDKINTYKLSRGVMACGFCR